MSPNPEALDPKNAKGPVIGGTELALVAAALEQHLKDHGQPEPLPTGTDEKGEPAALPLSIPVVMVGNSLCLGPFEDGAWAVLTSRKDVNDIAIHRVSPRQAHDAQLPNAKEPPPQPE